MEDQVINERTLELIISKVFDELTLEENEELSNIVKQDEGKDLIEGLIQDKEKLLDYITEYTKVHVECDNKKLENAKREFDKEIAKIIGN